MRIFSYKRIIELQIINYFKHITETIQNAFYPVSTTDYKFNK